MNSLDLNAAFGCVATSLRHRAAIQASDAPRSLSTRRMAKDVARPEEAERSRSELLQSLDLAIARVAVGQPYQLNSATPQIRLLDDQGIKDRQFKDGQMFGRRFIWVGSGSEQC